MKRHKLRKLYLMNQKKKNKLKIKKMYSNIYMGHKVFVFEPNRRHFHHKNIGLGMHHYNHYGRFAHGGDLISKMSGLTIRAPKQKFKPLKFRI